MSGGGAERDGVRPPDEGGRTIGWAEDFESSLWVTHIKPTLDFVVRIAELVALGAVFRVAADQVESMFLDAMALILILVIGAYAGFPLGMFLHRFRGVTVKSWKVASAIALPLGALVALGSYLVGREASEAVKLLSAVSVSDR